MSAAYKIVRVHAALGMDKLEVAVNEWLKVGWELQGSPFLHAQSQEWCQAMSKAATVPNGQVKLREPRR